MGDEQKVATATYVAATALPAEVDSKALEAEFMDDVTAAAQAGVAAAQAIALAKQTVGGGLAVRFCALRGDVYAVMVVIRLDSLLMKMGKLCAFPRGFPVLWTRGGGKFTASFGFRPKFANDTKSTAPFPFAPVEVEASVKWSGFMSTAPRCCCEARTPPAAPANPTSPL